MVTLIIIVVVFVDEYHAHGPFKFSIADDSEVNTQFMTQQKKMKIKEENEMRTVRVETKEISSASK